MQNFKGLLPRILLSDQAMGALVKRSEEFRKITIQSTEITVSILKVYQVYLLHLPRIMGFLLGQEKENPEPFYVQIKEIYLEIYQDYQNFILDTLQTPTNQISNNNCLKWSNFSGFLLTFQKQLNNYILTENSTFQIAKKYFKNQKLLANSIEAYKESFTEAKLIYNQDQKIKRYSACQIYSQASAQDLSNIDESKVVLYNMKKELIKSFELLSQEMSNYQNEIDIKTFKFLSKFNFEYCQSLKRRLEIIKQKKTKLQSIKELQFFRDFNLDDRNQMNERRQRRVIQFSETFGKGKTEIGFEQVKKVYLKIQKFIETKKLEHQEIYQFHIEFYKTADKKCLVQLKESLLNFEKNQKKIKEQFQAPCCQQLKNTFAIIRATLDIYTEIQKKISPKIQIVFDVIQQYKLILKSMQQEILSITQKLMEESKEKQFVDSQLFNQKVTTIQMMISFNEEKLKDCLTLVRTNYMDILNIYQTSIKESYEKFQGIGNHSAQICDKMINKTKEIKIERLKNSVFLELLKEETKSEISFEITEKNNDFKKLKRPTQIEVIEKEKEGTNINKQEEEQCIAEGEQNYDESPVKNKTKHLDFLKTKITFVQGEEIIRTFSCAMADKIILQGRLYVTNFRLCFFSKFNTSNVFFGETLIQVPKKDIIRLEKRKNGIFFDNSISITTIKGQVFLTSFFKRNEAFQLISQIIGMNQEQQAYQNEQESEKQSQLVDNRNVSESIVTSSFATQMVDDIKEQEISGRAQKIKQMQSDFNFNFKEVANAEFCFKSLSAYKVLKLYLLNNDDFKVSGKKYNNVIEYFKTSIALHKDLICPDYEPSLKQHLNPQNIKSTCPLKVTKKVTATTPIPNPGIPFMPKTTKTTQFHELYIISKHRWELNNTVQSSGAPYTDSFKINFRTICQSTEESCKIVSMIFVNFHKNVMVKAMIESKSIQESTVQFKKQYDELKKCIGQQIKQEKKKLQVSSFSPQIGNDQTSIPTANKFDNDELNEKIKQLEQQINSNKEKSEKQIKELTKSVFLYRTALLAVIGFYLLSIVAWLF